MGDRAMSEHRFRRPKPGDEWQADPHRGKERQPGTGRHV
jgi:hypothetical protein